MMDYQVAPYGSDAYNAAVLLREEILRAPLGLQMRREDTQSDNTQTHFVATSNGQILACVSATTINNGTTKLRQMAVSLEHQGKGVGKNLLAFAEAWLRKQSCTEIVLHARTHAQGFYEACGYRAHGEEFIEVGLPHIIMRKSL